MTTKQPLEENVDDDGEGSLPQKPQPTTGSGEFVARKARYTVREPFMATFFSTILIDEAYICRNFKNIIPKLIQNLPSRSIVAATATPLQNKISKGSPEDDDEEESERRDKTNVASISTQQRALPRDVLSRFRLAQRINFDAREADSLSAESAPATASSYNRLEVVKSWMSISDYGSETIEATRPASQRAAILRRFNSPHAAS
ncbi:hypothetical protein SAPIO_CDS5742 [Scedosporium apiospermum]|uniref:Uncharacterized protein n=1 Tax=Pseudallescheria apiosperma TaxID=563466 RepID=A0A084G5B1_PSEDA|nr:uncharacterized protein SAPIO_CDS5742 [Scedosporium apiospermum]KEZ42523.1 hypothetical protein SAPIO_CDS5742 [Scedosporium apiospermum]